MYISSNYTKMNKKKSNYTKMTLFFWWTTKMTLYYPFKKKIWHFIIMSAFKISFNF